MPQKFAQPDGSVPRKPSLAQNLGALVAGVLAVKLATYVTVTAWRLATREDPPQMDEAVGALKKAIWIALIGAATGAARQTVRDLIKPPTVGAA
jgi:hypothetical protein